MAKKLHTFAGETAAHAMQKAKDAYGENLLIVETKEIRKRTFTQPGLYELVVEVEGEDTTNVKNQNDEQISPNKLQQKIDEIALKELAKKRLQKNNPGVSLQISDVAQIKSMVGEVANIVQNDLHIPPQKPRVAPKKVITPANPYRSAIAESTTESSINQKELDSKIEDMQRMRINQTQAERAELREIRQELDKINDKMKIIQNMFWEERAPEGLSIPQEFAEIYRLAKASGMNKEHLDSIMRLSLELMPLRMRENSVTIKRYFREVLRKMIFCRSENLPLGQKKILMLVGPTGVGKTTTLAKLAARYSIMLEKRHKVGIITLDTYRLAAVDQLMAYARMMRLSIDTVVEPDEFGKAIDSLRHCDVILIDTAGHSQHDRQKLEALKSYVDNDYKIDVSLVLALNAKYEDLRDTYNAFGGMLDIDTIIFSKLDESKSFGNMFSLIYETKKPISYLSIGQSVPNDLILATNDYLVDCLLDGFKKPEEKGLL
ncbi:flagellar biosynthesis protein FlhF [Helicobacter himalayensis]|uniref:flagellar biosynthesis protein FlhF n=1 Tax=Helicobacter himalayensis TaxID=1591088 RepID=UPI0008372A55|nr:flagellar biosynthesis protein FlhF [Helicobacter himalayensis]